MFAFPQERHHILNKTNLALVPHDCLLVYVFKSTSGFKFTVENHFPLLKHRFTVCAASYVLSLCFVVKRSRSVLSKEQTVVFPFVCGLRV